MIIATTRPETLLGDTAVAVHPDPEAALNDLQKQLEEKLAESSDKDKEAVQASLDNITSRRESKLKQ